jgi:uncharacterized protein YjbJ (UPF0337 family)
MAKFFESSAANGDVIQSRAGHQESKPMNKDTLKDEDAAQGYAQGGALTNGDMAAIKGDRDVLLSRLQERYGHTREEVEREFDDWSVKPRG